ncbi:MAG: HNH endonuclease, partial [Caldilineaceae bacterium SB0665_bin_21]|nr:HNH endonuclease [Caldilineaceae bacterium SB0665_bin_21]
YTVEHLMPRKWSEEEWPLTTNNGQQSDDELRHLRDVRERKIEFIGNLTLATRKLNSTTGNKPWSEKKKELANHSSLFLNRDLLQSSPKAWDEAAIDARSQVVADLVLKTWPLPAGI